MAKPPTPKSVNEQIKAYKIRETRPWEKDLVYHQDNPVPLGEFQPPPAIIDRKSTRLNSSHSQQSRMPSSA